MRAESGLRTLSHGQSAVEAARARPVGAWWRLNVLGNWPLVLGVVIVGALLLVALLAPALAPYNPLQERRVFYSEGKWVTAPFAPGAVFPLGTDLQGRDILSNLLYGARYTLAITALVVLVRLVVGVVLGSVAGWYHGRRPDAIITAIGSAFGAFPALLLGMVAILAFDVRVGLQTFVVALCLTGWAELAQYLRAEVISLRARPFVDGARVVGLSGYGIAVRHLLPNLLPGLAALAALEMSGVLLLLGELGFVGIFVGGGTRYVDTAIGAGGREQATVIAQFGTPEWGALISQARNAVFQAPWVAIYPPIAFFVAVLGFNLLGRGLRRLLEHTDVSLTRLLKWRYLAAAVAVAVALNTLAANTGEAAALTGYARAFDGERVKRDIETLAQPAWHGRKVGTPGEEAAAQWLADQMREIGLEPAGDRDTYFQSFTLPGIDIAAMPSFELSRLDGSPARALLPRIDFREAVGGAFGGGTAEGPLVFLGAGLDEPAFSEYRGVEVAGRVLVLLGGPRGKDPVENAIKRQAAGVVFISRDETGDSIRLRPSYSPYLATATLPVVTVSREVGAYLLGSTLDELKELQKSLDEMEWQRGHGVLRSRELPFRARFEVPLAEIKPMPATNVLGLIPGVGAGRQDSYVIVGGHFDGVGDEPDGTRYPAANDNASGTATVLEIARLMKAQGIQPQNSVIFAAWTAEEVGLLGSEHFVARGRLKSSDIAAYLNLDVVGQGKSELVGITDESYAMYALAKNAADRLGIRAVADRNGASSDQQSFLKRRVPSVAIFWGGFDGGIHVPYDRVENIDPAKLRAVGMVGYQTLLQLAVAK